MSTPEISSTHSSTTLIETVRGIVDVCFSAALLERQRQFARYNAEYQPVEPESHACLAAYQDSEGAWQHTYIGNVRQIRAHSQIDAGAIVGDHATLLLRAQVGAGAVVEPFATLEHDVVVGPESRVEQGAYLLVGASVGSRAIIGSGAEINYDACVPECTKVLPDQMVS